MSNTTGFKEAQDQIRDHFADNWSSTPFTFENVKFEGDPKTDHVIFAVREGPSLQITSGSPGACRWRTFGNVVIAIYGRLDDGAGKVRTYADTAAAIFRGKRISNISFNAPRVVPVGRDQQNYRINVMVPFTFDIIA